MLCLILAFVSPKNRKILCLKFPNMLGNFNGNFLAQKNPKKNQKPDLETLSTTAHSILLISFATDSPTSLARPGTLNCHYFFLYPFFIISAPKPIYPPLCSRLLNNYHLDPLKIFTVCFSDL